MKKRNIEAATRSILENRPVDMTVSQLSERWVEQGLHNVSSMVGHGARTAATTLVAGGIMALVASTLNKLIGSKSAVQAGNTITKHYRPILEDVYRAIGPTLNAISYQLQRGNLIDVDGAIDKEKTKINAIVEKHLHKIFAELRTEIKDDIIFFIKKELDERMENVTSSLSQKVQITPEF